MLRVGTHSHLFRGPPAAVAAAFRANGLTCTQLTPAFPGQHFRDPADITPDRCRRLVEPFLDAGIAVAALSAGPALLEPDLERRHRTLMRLHALVEHCREFGTNLLVAEPGGLAHDRQAWTELLLVLAEVLRRATDHGVKLLLRFGAGQVVGTRADARRLTEELPVAGLGFVLDPAEWLRDVPAECWPAALEEGLQEWGAAPLLHVKDIRLDHGRVCFPPVGQGQLPYGPLLKQFLTTNPGAAILVEHVQPHQVSETRLFLDSLLAGSENSSAT
jgi:sugar phosphate isomerase/epimerase